MCILITYLTLLFNTLPPIQAGECFDLLVNGESQGIHQARESIVGTSTCTGGTQHGHQGFSGTVCVRDATGALADQTSLLYSCSIVQVVKVNCPFIHSDGFESGDTSQWSEVLGDHSIFNDGFESVSTNRWTLTSKHISRYGCNPTGIC